LKKNSSKYFIGFAIYVCLYAEKVELVSVFSAQYGTGIGNFSRTQFAHPEGGYDPCRDFPTYFAIDDQAALVYDIGNRRIQIVSLALKNARVFDAKDIRVPFGYFSVKRRFLVDDECAYIIAPNDSFIAVGELEYNLLFTLDDFVVIRGTGVNYYTAKTGELFQDSLPPAVDDHGDYMIVGKPGVIVSSNVESLRKGIREQYEKLSGTNQKEPKDICVFPGPDEIGLDSSCRILGLTLLKYDADLSSYWLAQPSRKNQQNSAWETTEKGSLIVKYDRLGKLACWFWDPAPEVYWHYGCESVVVNDEGRIFRMVYHETEGIKILEYVYKNRPGTCQKP